MSRIYCNEGWQFTPEFQESIVYEDCRCPMEEVRIPHTCKELPFHYFHEDIIYRRITFRPRQGGKNYINVKRIMKIGWESMGNFHRLRKDLRNDRKRR